MTLTRRSMVTLSTAIALSYSALSFKSIAAEENGPPGPKLGEPEPFRPAIVRERARALAAAAYEPPRDILPNAIKQLTYDQYRDIRYRPEAALWREDELAFQLQFFHLGHVFETSVDINIVSDNASRRLIFATDLFSYGNVVGEPTKPDREIGFAGFRIHSPLNREDYFDEFAVFQGASYFRGVGAGQAYGLSARGLAVATADPEGEEFPYFREFWVEEPTPDAGSIVVHALLDSPSTTGAYRFTLRPGIMTVMDVQMTLYPRTDLGKVGLAPLTSMFLFSAHDRVGIDDFRPAVHDSDGLLMWNGRGEWLWRPLTNPDTLQVSSFLDDHPHGFGLLQRERSFASYQDMEAHYERRPSLWVEPIGDWGDGAVHLVEIPIDSESHDNIVAFWRPSRPLAAGEGHQFAYRLHWCIYIPVDSKLAKVRRTMIGRAGAGLPANATNNRVVVVEFEADGDSSSTGDEVTAEVMIGGEPIETPPVLQFNSESEVYRVSFELDPHRPEPIDLRCLLRRDGRPASEVWLLRWPV